MPARRRTAIILTAATLTLTAGCSTQTPADTPTGSAAPTASTPAAPSAAAPSDPQAGDTVALDPVDPLASLTRTISETMLTAVTENGSKPLSAAMNDAATWAAAANTAASALTEIDPTSSLTVDGADAATVTGDQLDLADGVSVRVTRENRWCQNDIILADELGESIDIVDTCSTSQP